MQRKTNAAKPDDRLARANQRREIRVLLAVRSASDRGCDAMEEQRAIESSDRTL